MGLDIYHLKAIATKPYAVHYTFRNHDIGLCNYILEDDAPLFNVPFDFFHSFIQNIDCPDDIERVYLIPKKPWTKQDIELYIQAPSAGTASNTALGHTFLTERQKANEHILLTDYEHIVVEGDDNAEQEADSLIERLRKQGCFVSVHSAECWIAIQCAPWIQRKGFYFSEVGYQRKGMDKKFWQRFCTSDKYYYALPEDFAFALQCVDTEKREEFRSSFIEDYEEGASFLYVNY